MACDTCPRGVCRGTYSGQPLCMQVKGGLSSAVEGGLVRRRFDLRRPALFFSIDRFLSNDRLFLSNDIFKWRSHEFGERDWRCRCFYVHIYMHFLLEVKASWTRRLGGIR